MKTNETFICPVCGGTVHAGARACPHCGADERTGWSDSTYLDGIDLGDDIDYDELVENEFPAEGPRTRRKIRWTVIVAAILLLLSIAGLLKIIL
jgi:glutaredoxin